MKNKPVFQNVIPAWTRFARTKRGRELIGQGVNLAVEEAFAAGFAFARLREGDLMKPIEVQVMPPANNGEPGSQSQPRPLPGK